MADPKPFAFVPVALAEKLVREHREAGWQPEYLERLVQTLPGQPPREVAKVPAAWVQPPQSR